jgi:hypothetical protein
VPMPFSYASAPAAGKGRSASSRLDRRWIGVFSTDGHVAPATIAPSIQVANSPVHSDAVRGLSVAGVTTSRGVTFSKRSSRLWMFGGATLYEPGGMKVAQRTRRPSQKPFRSMTTSAITVHRLRTRSSPAQVRIIVAAPAVAA